METDTCEDEADIRVGGYKPQYARSPGNHQKLESPGRVCVTALGGSQPCWPQTPSLQTGESFCCVCHAVHGALYGSPGEWIQGMSSKEHMKEVICKIHMYLVMGSRCSFPMALQINMCGDVLLAPKHTRKQHRKALHCWASTRPSARRHLLTPPWAANACYDHGKCPLLLGETPTAPWNVTSE